MNLKSVIAKLPQTPGVYSFLNKKNEIIYVGKALSLRERVKNYLHPKDLKTQLMVKSAFNFKYLRVFDEFSALILEANLIKKYQPKYNLVLKDDKSFLYIAVTSEEFPKVLSVRKNEIDKLKYLFGPFPSANTVRQVLKFLRRVFPYCQQKNNSRPCFWSHLGLCSPCPGEIMQQNDKAKKRQSKKRYLENIQRIQMVLSGKSKTLLKSLKKQMDQASKSLEYEKAAFLKNQINQLKLLTDNRYPISFYLEKANFFDKEITSELTALKKILDSSHGRGSNRNFYRIECYDISNLKGQQAAGSMVVFINGIASKKDYRRFKIGRSKGHSLAAQRSGAISKGWPYENSRENLDSRLRGNDDRSDVAMISEILQRRLNHHDWPYPDLIIVDGGKPQVSAAIKTLQRHCEEHIRQAQYDEAISSLSVIGLAKRLETIIIPIRCHPNILQFSEINLSFDSPALHFLQRLRDESHRFALSYHKKLRQI